MVTTSLGRLTLDLAVRLSEFTQGMSRAERETAERTKNMQNAVTSFKQNLVEQLGGTQIGGVIDNLSSKLGGLSGGAGVAAAGLAGLAVGGVAVAIGGLASLAVSTAQADAQLAVFANRANTSVQNFQVLSVAAQGLGVSQEQLSSILADTQEKLGEFSATRGGGAADFFEALKNNTKMTDDQIKEFGRTLQGKDGVEAVQLIKNKLDELGASAQEQRFVLESLASDLGNLSAVFDDGGEILNQYRDALEEAGVIKSQEAIEQSQLLAAQTMAVQQRFGGLKSQLAGQMIPVLSGLAEHFVKGGEKGSSFGVIINGVGYVAKGVASAIIVISGVVAQFGSAVGQVITQIGNVGRMGYAVLTADTLEERMRALSQGFTNMGNDFGDFVGGSINNIKSMVNGVTGIINSNLSASSDALTQANLSMMKAQQAHTKGLKIDTEAAKENAKANEKANKARAAEKTNNMVSNTALKGLKIKSSEATAGGKIRQATADFAHVSSSVVGGNLKYFSAFNDRYHLGRNSHHNQGMAFDIVLKDAKQAKSATAEIQAAAKQYGYAVKVINEYAKPSKHSTGGHIHVSVLGYANGNGSTADIEHMKQQASEVRKIQNDLENSRQSVTQRYATQAEKDSDEHHQNIVQIESAYAKGSKERTEYLAKEKERYQQVVEERELDRKLRYAEGEEKITLEYQKKILQIKRDFAGDESAYTEMLTKAKAAYEEDLANFQWAAKAKERAQQEMVQKLSEGMSLSSLSSVQEMMDIVSRSNMSPEDYQVWQIESTFDRSKQDAESAKSNRIKEINAVDGSTGDFLIDAQARQALLEQAEQEHVDRMALIHATYHANLRDAEKQIAEQRVQTATQSFAAQTEAMKTFFGEQSGIYRAAAIMERSYAVYQAIMNAEETRSNVYTSIAAIPHIGPKLAGPMSVAAVAIQVANAARIGNTPIPSFSGVAHGGMDYIPKETTFLLDKGERVLSPRQNRDLTNYLSQRQKGVDNDGNTINVNVNVDSNGGDVQADHAFGKQMGEAMVATVYKVLYKEKRQGGILE